MKALTRRALSLVLLLTQAAAIFASPSFYLCISPNGNICFDAIWSECTCCHDEDDGVGAVSTAATTPAQESSPSPQGGDEDAGDGCGCSHCGTKPSPAALPARPAEEPVSTWQGKPCRCKHVPLAVAQDATDVASSRISVVERSPLLAVCSPAQCGHGFRDQLTAFSVNLLSHPPPSHLLAIACTVLRC